MLFDQQGYFKTSMNDVAQAVHLAKPSLYHYFPKGKSEILFLIHEEFVAALLSAHVAHEEKDVPESDRLHRMMSEIVGVIESMPSHVRVFFEYYRELPNEQLEIVQGNARRYRRIMEEIIEDGVKSGEFTSNTDVKATTLAIFGMCSWVYQWYRAGDRLTAEEIADDFFKLVMQGLSDTSAPTRPRLTAAVGVAQSAEDVEDRGRRAARVSTMGPSDVDTSELGRLRRENAELRDEREVLKKSVILWMKEATKQQPPLQ